MSQLKSRSEIVELKIAKKLDILWKSKRYKVLFGGRGAAKSWGIAQELILKGHEQKLRILCTREIQKSIKDSVLKLLEDTVARCGLQDVYQVQNNTIKHLITGTEFIFAGLRYGVNSIKSVEGIDIVWVEEAQDVSESSWKILIPTVRAVDSEIWVSFNPNLETDPTYQRFVLPYLKEITENGLYEDDRVVVAKVNYDDNPWFPDVLRDEMERDRDRDMDMYLHVWEGECVVHSEARVFKDWRVEDFDTPDDATHYFGADWGFSVDPTTLLRCHANHDDRILYFDYEAYGVGVEIDDTPALFDTVPGARQWKITADNARPETISYMKRKGFKVEAAKKGAGSIEEGVNFLKSYTLIVHPRCKNLINELKFYRYKTDRLTGDILPILEDKNNHCIVGDTIINTTNGDFKISELVGKSGEVRSFDGEKPVTRKFSDCRMTRKQADIIEIGLEDGRSIKLTHDHLVLTQFGWVPAGKLGREHFIIDVGS